MDKSASAIREEIEQTRERMGDTVEALAYKADVPSRVKDGVNDRVDAVKGTIVSVVDNVKTAMAGATDNVKAAVGDASDNLSDVVDRGGRTGSDVLSRARENLSATAAKVNDGFGDRIAAADVAGNAQRAVGAVSDNAQRAVNVVQENPIGLALAGLAIGFLTGSLFPVSDVERKQFGPLRDKIVDQAQAATTDLIAAGKAVVAETAQTAVSTAFNSVQSHAHDVADAAKARAQEN